MSEGGSYIREEDGSLTLVQRTQQTTAAPVAEGGAMSTPKAEADGTAASAQPARRTVRKEA